MNQGTGQVVAGIGGTLATITITGVSTTAISTTAILLGVGGAGALLLVGYGVYKLCTKDNDNQRK